MDFFLIEAPGKLAAWNRLLASAGLDAEVLATSGHVCAYPESMRELGISLEKVSDRSALVRETLRLDKSEAAQMLVRLASRTRPGDRIFVATDDDSEGDVIAWDICRSLLGCDRALAERILRLRPNALTPSGLRRSLASATRLMDAPDAFALAAIPGRARAALDRWIGHALSEPGLPAGRVLFGALGALATGEPSVETGEVILRARSATGGSPFIARISLAGKPDARLAGLAARYAPGFVPGAATAIRALGAAAAPARIGPSRPFNTAQALITASRRHGLSVTRAAAGLQKAYLNGTISYPRVDSTTLSAESAIDCQHLAAAAGVTGFEGERLRLPTDAGSKLRHEALHPLLGGTLDLAGWMKLLGEDAAPEQRSDADTMAMIVARAAIEAGLVRTLVPGSWDGQTGDPEDDELLAGLEWVQERGPAPPWSRQLETGIRFWPLDGMLVELMAKADLARPSTYAHHAAKLEDGLVEIPETGVLPRPSPRGRAALAGKAGSLARPGLSNAMEAALAVPAQPRENASIPEWISRRISEALRLLSAHLRAQLLAAAQIVEKASVSPAPAPVPTPPSAPPQPKRADTGASRPPPAPRPRFEPEAEADPVSMAVTGAEAGQEIADEIFPSRMIGDGPGF